MKAMHGAGWLAHFQRDPAAARAALEESLAVARELDDRWTVAWLLHVLGRVAYFDGDNVAARELAETSLAIAERLGDRWLVAWAVQLLALAAHLAGDHRSADALYEQSLAIRQELGHREAIGILYELLGQSAQSQGQHARALRLYREYLAIARELGSTWHVSKALAHFGAFAATLGQPERAARLCGAAEFFLQTSGSRSIPLVEAVLPTAPSQPARRLVTASAQPGRPAGRCLRTRPSPKRCRSSSRSTPDRPSSRADPLLPRECEMAALIARGLSNREIASELMIAERTVGVHVEHVLDELGFGSRTQIGVWAAAQSPISQSADLRLNGVHRA